MKTKDTVRHWLLKHEHLRDNDNKLCANIWNEELKKYIMFKDSFKNSTIKDFLRLYSLGKLTSAPSIKRARAKLQEEEPELRGKKYYMRKGTYQKEWRKKLGYEANK